MSESRFDPKLKEPDIKSAFSGEADVGKARARGSGRAGVHGGGGAKGGFYLTPS